MQKLHTPATVYCMNSETKQPIVLSVSQLTQAIKMQLESTFPLIWVRGEVSNLKIQASGHVYFSLKDAYSQIAAVAFKPDAQKIVLMPKDGDQVLVRAEMNVWPPRGSYQLVVRELSHVGRGEELIKLELLKKKLHGLGYFDKARKRLLPKFPKTIGIVTSPTGAVLQDMLNILSRRMVGFHVIVNPVKVQGEGASDEIARAIQEMNTFRLGEVLVVCRGGGSFEDLAPFNTEVVAKAIFESRIPVVSAVGHETDVSISDFVADVRAPTPSAAAELISHVQQELVQKLDTYKKTLIQLMQNKLTLYRKELARAVKHPVLQSTTAMLGPRWLLLDEMRDKLDFEIKRCVLTLKNKLLQFEKAFRLIRPSRKLQEDKNTLMRYEKELNVCMQRLMQEKQQKLTRIVELLKALHPDNVLAKGYSILFSEKKGIVVSSISQIEAGDKVSVKLVDGTAHALVTTLEEKT